MPTLTRPGLLAATGKLCKKKCALHHSLLVPTGIIIITITYICLIYKHITTALATFTSRPLTTFYPMTCATLVSGLDGPSARPRVARASSPGPGGSSTGATRETSLMMRYDESLMRAEWAGKSAPTWRPLKSPCALVRPQCVQKTLKTTPCQTLIAPSPAGAIGHPVPSVAVGCVNAKNFGFDSICTKFDLLKSSRRPVQREHKSLGTFEAFRNGQR